MRGHAATIFAFLAACSSGGSSQVDPDAAIVAGPDADLAASAFDSPAIKFQVATYDWGVRVTGTSLTARPLNYQTETNRDGWCRLLELKPALCDPKCAPLHACIEGECVAEPEARDLGTISVSGLQGAPVEILPQAAGSYYWDSGEPIAAQSEITLEAPAASLTLSSVAPEFLAPTSDWDADFEARGEGEDITLAWSNSIPGSRVYLRMTDGLGSHGGLAQVEIECEGPDTGELTIPGEFLETFYQDGSWSCGDCGLHKLFRLHRERSAQLDAELWSGGSANFFTRPLF
jgi:hypothetical protein